MVSLKLKQRTSCQPTSCSEFEPWGFRPCCMCHDSFGTSFVASLLIASLDAMKGDASWAVLEQARSKLLLAHVPKGSSTNLELQTRFRLWQDAAFGRLLERIELQARAAASPEAKPVANRGKRSRAMAQGGAFRKSLQALQ